MVRFKKILGWAVIIAFAGLVAAGLTPRGAVAGGGCRGMTSTEATGDSVRMIGTCFVPTVLHVEPGTPITWTNESPERHNVAGATIEWGDYQEFPTGGSVQHSFDKPGIYPYYCFVHNGMIGAIVVGDGHDGGQPPGAEVANIAARLPAAPESLGASVARETDAPRNENAGDNPFLFTILGTLLGAVAVAVSFGIRKVRNT